MRVLYITENFIKGGKERRLIELLKAISEQPNIDPAVIILSKKIDFPEIYSLNLKIYLLERKVKKDITLFFSIYKICKSFKPDIIHSWGSMPSIYCLPSVVILKPKFINAMISNGICKNLSKNHFRALLTYPFSDVIIANSQAGLKAYHVPQIKGQVIYNGFSFQRLENLIPIQDIKSELHISTKYVVGMVGAFHKRKDYMTFIRAASLLLQKRQDITFLAIGEGDLLEFIRSQVDQKLINYIKFPGLIHNIESFINIFDIGILLTNPLFHEEGISNSILEYMALSKPVIATNGGGTVEIVIDKDTGFLVKPFDIQVLVEKIEILLEDPILRMEMGEKGRQRIIKLFSISQMINKTISTYNSVTSIHT